MSILKNLKRINTFLSPDVKLIAVTKKRSIREINQLLFLGITDLGESTVQEAKEKKPFIKGVAKWHLIGHLQRNKVSEAVEIFDMIQSVDSLALAKKIDSVASSKKKKMSILIQVNISKESQKFGIQEEELIIFLKQLSVFKNIKVLGLMAIPPNLSAEESRPFFKRMTWIFKIAKQTKIPNIDLKYLSMGMSNDFVIAIEEGSNMIRIGSELFKS